MSLNKQQQNIWDIYFQLIQLYISNLPIKMHKSISVAMSWEIAYTDEIALREWVENENFTNKYPIEFPNFDIETLYVCNYTRTVLSTVPKYISEDDIATAEFKSPYLYGDVWTSQKNLHQGYFRVTKATGWLTNLLGGSTDVYTICSKDRAIKEFTYCISS